MNRIGLILIGLFIISDSCIEPLTYHPPNERNLVVDGMITDQPGPYIVLLYYSKKIGSEIYTPEKAIGCSVSIEVDNGDTELLKEVSEGVYQTNTIQGKVGLTYTLNITNVEGQKYQSEPETMLPVGDFLNFYYEFEQIEPPYVDSIITHNGFNLFVDAQIAPNQKHHIRWKRHDTFKVFTYPLEKFFWYTGWAPGSKPMKIHTPVLPCGKQPSCDCCTCCTCWVNPIDNVVRLSDDNLSGSNTIKHQFIGFVPASRRFLYEKYRIVVDQMSLTDKAFDYWKRISAQGKPGSDLFQTPPPNTYGNIKTITPEAPQAFGIFTASAVRSRTMDLTWGDVPYDIVPIDSIRESCLIYFPHSTTEKPKDW